MKNPLNFPVSFTSNLARIILFFSPRYVGLPTATEASFKVRAKAPCLHYFSCCFSLRWFRFELWTWTSLLQCFPFSASVCVSCKWMEINYIFLPVQIWPSWMAITPAGYGAVRDSDGLMSLLARKQMREEIPSQSILVFFSLAAAILCLDLVRFLQLQLVKDRSSPLYLPSLCLALSFVSTVGASDSSHWTNSAQIYKL